MTYYGQLVNGKLQIEGGAIIPEGTRLKIEAVENESDHTREGENSPAESHSLMKLLEGLAGTVEGLPPDASLNHDHYIYGTPKQYPDGKP